jgi:uncharacterized membrane protein
MTLKAGRGTEVKSDTRDWVELVVASAIPLTILGMIANRIMTNKGLGVRAIQYLAVSLGIPVIVLLAMEGILDGAVVGTLLGGVFGYLLSNISNYDKSGSDS